MTLRRTLMLALLFTAGAAAADGKPVTNPDAQAVDQACADDAKTAGCATEQVGSGMLKCIHAYKKEHKDWKVSPACHDAMKKAHADHAARHGGETPPAPDAK